MLWQRKVHISEKTNYYIGNILNMKQRKQHLN
jgi:hypothetical protein